MRRPPHIYHARRVDQYLRRRIGVGFGLVAILIVAWISFALVRSVPGPQLEFTIATHPTIGGTPLSLRPGIGAQEAVAVEGIGTIAAGGAQTPTPIASLTKMMSALVVLHDHPLSPGERGPNITITAADVASYRREKTQDDSVVKVRIGEQLTELQALEGALIPSGDNIIQLLATWDAGNAGAFVRKMNALAHDLGMDHTHYAGPSGVNPATVSTASDQLRLAEAAMTNPVFAGIVAMPEVDLPLAGVQYNVDADLGSDGIDGVKTGWVPQGGGCFVFSAERNLDGANVSVIGTILGEEGATPIPTALSTAKQLVVSVEQSLHRFHLAAGTRVAELTSPYASPVRVVTASPISFVDWNSARLKIQTQLSASSNDAAVGSPIGTLTVRLGRARVAVALTATALVRDPSFGWRLIHL